MHILLPSDVFPPKCGGAGWSAHALALALQQRGHVVEALVPTRGCHGLQEEQVLGIRTKRRGYAAPNLPFLQNYYRHERLWPVLAADLIAMAAGTTQPTVIHAQHVQVAPAAVLAGQRLRVPVVITVRDHWPWDYFATGLHGGRVPLPQQNWRTLLTDLPARLGGGRGVVAWAAIPYILAHMQRRRAALCRADAVVAVSEYMAARLRQFVDPARVHVILNMVDLAAIDQVIATPPYQSFGQQLAGRLDRSYALFVGKLEQNKGADLLPTIWAALQAKMGCPTPQLVIAGDGTLRSSLERELGLLGARVLFLEWAEHDLVLQLMAHAQVLLYPSGWGEPLTRVLLEAAACGVPAIAMPTGGTSDIVQHRVSGMLTPTATGLGQAAAEVITNSLLQQKLAQGARRMAEQRFAVASVVGQFERLYEGMTERR